MDSKSTSKENWWERAWYFLKNHSGLTVIIAAAILLQTISAVQYYYMRNLLADELEKRAEIEMTTKAVIVKNALNLAENTLNDHLWDMERNMVFPDSMYGVGERVLRAHPNLLGCGICFVPNFYPEKGRLFEPYVYRQLGSQGKEVFVREQAAGPYHDYTQLGFYKATMRRKTTFWSYPYYNDMTNSHIVTFCKPIHNEKKDIVAVFGLDIELKWLSDTLNYRHIYPSSYNFMLTETGQLIAGPQHESDEKREEMENIIRLINDSTVQKSISKSGRSTVLPIEDPDGDKGMVFYTSFKGKPKWQIALVCYDKEVYSKLNTMRLYTGILMVVGLLVLGLMIIRFAKNDRKLHKANLEKERIGGELRVASQIQQSMLPKEEVRGKWLEVRGLLKPAREVGGDLYDYFIRDEKLFFCIGDVSGKGAASAMVMGVIHSLFRAFSAHENNPARIMQAINEISCQGNDSNIFVTLFIGVLDLPTGHLRYCDAGHDAPMIASKESALEALPVIPHLPVGVFDDVKYGTQETQLLPDSTLFLYTDGLTEAKNSDRKQFGVKRVEDALASCLQQGMTLEGIMTTITEEVHAFVKEARQSDDLTMLAIRYTPVQRDLILDEELTLQNDLQQVRKLNSFVKQVMERLQVEKSLAKELQLAMEEAVVNVIEYAYPTEKNGEITIKMMSDGSFLKIMIIDSGVFFDPTTKTKTDIEIPVQDRQIGGLGILLVRELMDSINYEREDGKNILTLSKKLKP